MTRLNLSFLPFIFFLAALFVQKCYSQSGIRLKHAEILVSEGKYEKAIQRYLKLYKKDSLDFDVNLGLGILFEEYVFDEDAALPYLESALRLAKTDTMPELTFALGKCRLHNADYEGALVLFNQCLKYVKTDEEGIALKKQILNYIDHCKTGTDYLNRIKTKKYRIQNMGPQINSQYPDYSPVCDSNNTFVIFTSRRPQNIGMQKDKYDDKFFEDVYYSVKDAGRFKNAVNMDTTNPLIEKFTNTADHDAIVSLTPDGKKLFFYKNNSLHVSEWNGKSWGKPVALPSVINVEGSYEPHATLSPDGKILVFTSNKIEGSGGLDLYMSKLSADGNWANPENLGPTINTIEDEDSPFFSPDGKQLYFASRGLHGYGGYDIFVSSFDGTTFGTPENLLPPINSPNEDIYFSISRDKTNGYFASSRKGGYGEMDIYRFFEMDLPSWNCCNNNEKPSRISFKSPDTIFVNELSMFDASVNSFVNEYPYHYYWRVNDSMLPVDSTRFFNYFRRNGQYRVSLHCIVYSDSSGARENYCYSKTVTVIERPKKEEVKIEPPIAKDESKIVITGAADVNKIDTSHLEVFKITLDAIYFDVNKSTLRPDAIKTINENINKLKVNNKIMVKITAHTDSRASKEFNLKLSQKRAQSVITYLGKKGIGKNRILAVVNMGEDDQIIADCGDDKECLEKTLQLNRRVEFKVIGVLPPPPAKKKKTPAKGAKKTTKKKK